MLLGFGSIWLGLITPVLQIVLAYLYFRNSHMWSRVLNTHLEKDGEHNTSRTFFYELYMTKQLLTNRTMH